LIYDPFTGIGTTQLSCIENYCDFIGSEIITEHYNIAIERVEEKRKEKEDENDLC
jgi:DNA modification methylase